jgi:NAD-dependent deacetylase
MPKNLLIFAGSELAAETGINKNIDFNAGTWKEQPLQFCTSKQGWEQDKKLVLEFYKERFEIIKKTEPLEIHKAVAKLQEKYSVAVINVGMDDFFERAGCDAVMHLKGASIDYAMCEWHPCTTNLGYHAIIDLESTHQYSCNYFDLHPYPIEYGEKCPKCDQGQLRPAIIWADEFQSAWEEDLAEMAKATSIVICLGNVSNYFSPGILSIPNKILIISGEVSNPSIEKTWDIRRGSLNTVGLEVIEELWND